jgi:hypothetical protein
VSEDSSQPVQPAAETETDQQPSPPPRFEPDEALFEWVERDELPFPPRFAPDESLFEWSAKVEWSAKAPGHPAEPEAERKADEQT